MRTIWTTLIGLNPQFIAYEDFKFRPNMMKAETHSLQLIGVIRLFCELKDIPSTFMLPTEAKAFWTDAKIRKLGLWSPGNIHAMDALRVLLTHRGKSDKRWESLQLSRLR